MVYKTPCQVPKGRYGSRRERVTAGQTVGMRYEIGAVAVLSVNSVQQEMQQQRRTTARMLHRRRWLAAEVDRSS